MYKPSVLEVLPAWPGTELVQDCHIASAAQLSHISQNEAIKYTGLIYEINRKDVMGLTSVSNAHMSILSDSHAYMSTLSCSHAHMSIRTVDNKSGKQMSITSNVCLKEESETPKEKSDTSSYVSFVKRGKESQHWIPSKVIPSKILPCKLLPSKFIPSTVIPSKVLLSKVIPSKGIPSKVLPSKVIPSKVLPSKFITSKVISPKVIPSNSRSHVKGQCG